MKNPNGRGTKFAAGLAIACAVATAPSSTGGIGSNARAMGPPFLQESEAAVSNSDPTSADCGVVQVNRGPTSGVGTKGRAVTGHVWSCIPPYETPAYSKPADDSVVFGSLLEASGYSPAANTNWVGVAAGNFCGNANRQLILVQNQSPNFTVLEGPAPRLKFTPGGTANLVSLGADPWRVATAGNLDGSAQDMLVAVRKVTTDGVPDLVLAKVKATCSCTLLDQVSGQCEVPKLVATASIGDRVNSDWVGAAVGNFDGTGKQIALLKTAHSNIFLVKLMQSGGSLKVVYTDDLPKDGSRDSAWKALAAGDIDGDGIDELIVAVDQQRSQSKTGHGPLFALMDQKAHRTSASTAWGIWPSAGSWARHPDAGQGH
jgi:FG-GAP repeat